MKEVLSYRIQNGVLFARVLGRLGMRPFLGWSFLQTLRVRFMDYASIEAYGACVYIVCNGRSQLLCSKSRVAPMKTLTEPKLELCGAELLSRLNAEVAGTSAFEGKYFMDPRRPVQIQYFCSEPSSCHSRAN